MTTPKGAATSPPTNTAAITGQPWFDRENSHGEATDTGEGGLAEPDHAPLAGH